MEDIRKTGPVGLKGINIQTGEEVDVTDFTPALKLGRTPNSDGIGLDLSFQSSVGNLGSSKYDENILTMEQVKDAENMRALNQSGLSKWINGITKGGVLAGTTFLDGTLGLVYGLGDMLLNINNKEESGWETFSRLWDNEFSNGMQAVNQWSEQILPNYRTKEERDRAWYQNLGTANFWADTFLKNMGFTVGAFASGSSFTKLMKGANLIKTGLGAATAGSVYGAINEARIEANNNSNDFYKAEQKKIEDSYKEEYEAIWNNGFNDIERKNELTAELNTKYQAIQEDLDVRKSKMGLGTFIGNSVFLSLNDFFTMGRLYAKGFQNARRTGKSISATADDLFASDQSISKYVTRQGDSWVANNISKAGAVGKGVTKGLLEGNEEMAQRFISGTSGEMYDTDSPDAYFNASLNSDAIVQTDDFLKAAITGFKDSYGNGDAYEEFAVGFLTGALGIPTFGRVNNSDASTVLGRGKPIGLTGGILGELSMANSANKEMNEAVAFMNKYEQKLKTNKEHFVRSQAFTNAMSGWSEANNAFEYKNAEDNDDFSAISRYAAMGKLDYLKTLINQDFENISDETLQAMARETSTDTAGWYNVDGTYTPDGEAGAQQMREELVKKRDQILAQIANYETAVRETRSIANDSLTQDQIEELAWLHWKGSRFKERYTQMKNDFPTFYTALTENLNDWEKALETLHEEGAEPEHIKNLKQTINLTRMFIDKINSSKELMNISSFLDSNKDFLEFIDTKDFYDAFGEHSTLSHADYQKAITNLRDIAKIANAYKSFNKRYKEFVENPTKLKKNRDKIKAKKEVAQRAVDKNTTVSKIDGFSKNELLNKIQDGEINLDDLKEAVGLDNIDVEGSIDTEVAKKVEEVENILTMIEDGKAEAMRMYQNGELDDQGLQDAIALIESSGSSAEGIDQVFDMDLESALNPDILADIEDESLLSEAEKAESKETRLDNARGKVNFIRSKITSRDKGIIEQPTSSPAPTEIGHDKSPTAETIQETKAKREAEANKNKELKDLLEKTDVVIEAKDKIQVKDAVIRMYSTIKTLFDNGLSSGEIFETLRKLPQYETLKKYSKVLQYIKDFVEGLYNPKPTKVVSEITLDDVSEQEVIVSPNEDVENQNKEIKNQISNEDASNYWQPSTSQFPIYRQDGSRIPFYKIASSLKKEDGTPRYTEAQIKRMEAVYKYLESKGTFAIRNSQTLAPKDAVHFIIDPTLNQEAGDVVILMADSKGNIIGDLVDTTHESAAKHANLIETTNAIKQEYTDWVNAGNNGLFTSQKYKSEIAQLMVGKVEYSEERRSLNEIFTVTTSNGATKQLPYKIAVVVADKAGKYKLTTTSESGGKKGVDPIGDSAITPLKGKKGQPFLLIPTNNPKRAFMPVSFAMPRYDRGTAKSTLGTIIDDILEDLKTADNLAVVSKRLAEHLGKAWRGDDGKLKTSFHINKSSKYVELASDSELRSGISTKEQRTFIKISYVPEKGKSALFTIELDPNDPEFVNKLKNEMFKHQIPFRINRKYLNKKIGNLDYNSVIGELANTNVEPGYVTTTNSWFTIAPVTPEGTVQKTDKIKTTGINPTATTSKPTAVTKTAIEYGGKTFYVDGQWNVTDETGKAYNKGENTLKFLGYAWGIIKGENMTKPYNTEWGMYDPIKKNYIPVVTEEAMPVIDKAVTIRTSISGEGESVLTPREFSNKENTTWYYSKDARDLDTTRKGIKYHAPVEGKGNVSHITWFPETASRGGGMTITVYRPLTQEEFDLIESFLKQNPINENDIYTFVYNVLQGKGKILTEKHSNNYDNIKVYENIPKTEEQGPALLYGKPAQEALPLHNPATGEVYEVSSKSNSAIPSGILKGFTTYYTKNGFDNISISNSQEGFAVYELPDGTKEVKLLYDTETIKHNIDAITDGLYNVNGSIINATEITVTKLPILDSNNKVISKGELWAKEALLTQKEDIAPKTKTKPELINELKLKGLLNTPKRQKMVEVLTDSQLNKILENKDVIIKQLVQKLELVFDNKTGTFKKNIDSIIGVDRNREAVGEYKIFDKEKELKWLESALPQFKDRVQLVEGLIKIVNGVNSDRAFGKFVNSHIILSDKAAEGTVYHEAFHAVVNTLLSESELLDLLNEGKQHFGVTSDIAAEEKLAEGFRRYIQTEQGFGGNIVKAFRKLKHYIQAARGNESIINKLYYDISQGYYADRKIAETEVDRNKEVDLTNYSLEELVELKDFLASKQFQVKHDNATKLVDYVMSNSLLKKAYELGLLKDVKHRGEKDTRRIVPKTTELNKLIRAKRKGETSHTIEVVSEREYSVYRPNLTREQRISEAALAWQERDVDTFDEINEYHEYKSNYDYLSLEDKQYVDSIGMSKEQWDKLQNKVKDAILHCK